MTCIGKFLGLLAQFKIDVKTCQKPVKINVKVDFAGYTFNKIFHGSENFPLSRPRLDEYGIILYVNANPHDIGGLHLEVRFWNRVLCFFLRSNH